MRQRIGFMLALTTFLSTGCYHQVVHTGATPDRDRGGPAIPVLPLPHHQACGSAPGGSVS